MCDNFYTNCPPRMGGFREITEYKTPGLLEENIKDYFGIVRDDTYRIFLQQNGQQILNMERQFLNDNYACHNNRCVFHQPYTLVDPVTYTDEMLRYNYQADQIPCYPYKNYPINPNVPNYVKIESNKSVKLPKTIPKQIPYQHFVSKKC